MKLRAPGSKPILLKPVLPSAAEEVAYLRQLQKLIKTMHESVKFHVLAAWREAGLPETDTQLAQDLSPQQQLKKALIKLGVQWQRVFDTQSKKIAEGFSAGTLSHHDRAFGAALRQAGFSVKFQLTPQVGEALDSALMENIELIKSIPAEYLEQVSEHVRESVEKGRSMKKLTEILEDRFGVTLSRAALIARDQNNKLTAVIHRARQSEVGIKKAQWIHTTASKQPREEHAAWSDEGAIYDIERGMYSDEDGEYVWPGTPINCGCTCLSIVPGSDEAEEEA